MKASMPSFNKNFPANIWRVPDGQQPGGHGDDSQEPAYRKPCLGGISPESLALT